MTALNTYRRWLARVEDDALRAELSALDEVRDAAQIEDRFYRDLAFGTGGLRGVLGAGTNRMNVYVVRRATQGLAAYLKAAGLPLRCAIAYDSRIGSGALRARDRACACRQRRDRLSLSAPGANARAELGSALLRMRGGRVRYGEPQPRRLQRLQGLRVPTAARSRSRRRMPYRSTSGPRIILTACVCAALPTRWRTEPSA